MARSRSRRPSPERAGRAERIKAEELAVHPVAAQWTRPPVVQRLEVVATLVGSALTLRQLAAAGSIPPGQCVNGPPGASGSSTISVSETASPGTVPQSCGEERFSS
jgi:hypothetical protein